MEKRNIIVIGASAGGFEVLKTLVKGLPSDLDASIFIVWHMSPDVRGILPEVLNRLNTIEAANACDNEAIQTNRIYVAPPDHHLLIDEGRLRITRGPKENRFRPAVDPLFRSAAYTYGNRVVGIILSGALDDGSAGMWRIKNSGGLCIVQDPSDAEVPSMPENAIRAVKIDYCVPAHELAGLIVKLSAEEVATNTTLMKDERTKVEIDIAAEGMEYFYPHEAFKKWYSCMFVKMDDGLAATNLNINERKHAEEERNRNYLLLQQSELIASTGTWDYDLATKTLSWSDGMYRLFNRRKEMEISPEIYIEYATPECQDTAIRIANQIKQGDAEFEESLTLNVGEAQKVINIKATNVKNEQGHPVRVLGVDVDTTASRQAEERLRQMEAEQQLEIFRVTLRTQEEERRRISESLHNGLGQLMYGIQISMNQLRREKALTEPEKYDQARSYTEKLVADAIKESRNISHELMPATLEQFGLRSAIDDVCQQLNGKVQFDVRYKDATLRLEKFLELAVFRTVQELMLNVVKHAGATKARVFVEIEPESIHLAVSDNGRGLTDSYESKSGIGLSSIRSKIRLLNGTVKITSVPGKGTEVTVDIPVNLRKN